LRIALLCLSASRSRPLMASASARSCSAFTFLGSTRVVVARTCRQRGREGGG
jgi:hypothetical protein